ncbi:hypothetical protein VNO77_23132 [Canavalia gladiata]|uniref:Secreted protein n=1 Tax=Canavalia gladiata TaxID=3824 RepID=A0AAN9L7B5_CANGL
MIEQRRWPGCLLIFCLGVLVPCTSPLASLNSVLKTKALSLSFHDRKAPTKAIVLRTMHPSMTTSFKVTCTHLAQFMLNHQLRYELSLEDLHACAFVDVRPDSLLPLLLNQKMRKSRKEFPVVEEKTKLQTPGALLRHDNHLMHPHRKSCELTV